MKSVKFYALALVLVLGLLGGAYAVWTDVLEAEGTIETGDLNVEFVYSSAGIPPANSPEAGLDSPVVVASASHTPDKMEFSLANIYPVEFVHQAPEVRFDFQSKGTTPVKLESADAIITWSNDDLKNYLYCRVRVDLHNGTTWNNIYSGSAVPLDELADEIEAAMDGVVLEEGYKVRFGGEGDDACIRIWLKQDAPNEMQNQRVDVELTMNFRQWNL